MDAKRILTFLANVAANNNRPWFQAHKDEYEACRADFEDGIDKLIKALSPHDPEIAHLTARDCCYRFYRDLRFSADKSPYKRHFGAYICAHGRKSLRGGYYIHMQPGNCLFAVGVYYLPTQILTACRNEIMANIDDWRRMVENKTFVNAFGLPNQGAWTDETITPKGFGMTCLKTAPKDFPRDYPYLSYLKMKDYTAWTKVPDEYFDGEGWITPTVNKLLIGKPMMDMMNRVVDDYE